MRGSMTAGVCATAAVEKSAIAKIAKAARMDEDRDMSAHTCRVLPGMSPPSARVGPFRAAVVNH